MKDQIQEAIDWFGDSISEAPATPAIKNLFNTDKKAEQLSDQKSEIFHSVVAKLVCITKRARPDIETAVSYLCTRVSKSTTDDWKISVEL